MAKHIYTLKKVKWTAGSVFEDHNIGAGDMYLHKYNPSPFQGNGLHLHALTGAFRRQPAGRWQVAGLTLVGDSS